MFEINIFTKIQSIVDGALKNISFRGAVLIGGGTALGQIITVLATPIVSRLYGPQAFGALAVFGSILTISSIVMTLRFEAAIPIPEDDDEAVDLLFLAIALSICAAGIVGLCLILWQSCAKTTGVDPISRHLFWTMPLGMFGVGCYQSFSYWAIRKRSYRPISGTRLNQSIASVGAQVLLFRLPPSGMGLILASILGQVFGVRTLFSAFQKSKPKLPFPSPARLRAVAGKYWNISAYGTVAAVAGTLGDSLPSLVLAKAFGLGVAGIYLMASRVFALPAQMVGSAVSQVFTGEASQRYRDDPASLPGYFHSIHKSLMWAGAAVLLLGVSSPWVLPWILGGKWHAAGLITALLAPMAAMDITVRPLYNITIIGNRPKLHLLTGLLPMGLSLIGLCVPIALGHGETIAISICSLSRCLGCWIVFLVYRHIAKTIGTAKGRGHSVANSVSVREGLGENSH